MAYIKGEGRSQGTLFPEVLDELVPADHVCRVVDAFVGTLAMTELGFERAVAADTGRPGYDPRDLLKLYLYGYLNQIRSSRRLEAECLRNVELMWLLGRLYPDHKSIAEFRRVHREAVTAAGATLVRFAKSCGLIRGEWIAIDGSKFRAVASIDTVRERIALQRYLDSLEKASLALNEGGSATYLFDRVDEVGRMALAALNSSEAIVGIAVAMPGPFEYSTGISWLQHKFSAWYSVNVCKHLAIRFGIDEKNVVFLNDADAFLLGELQESFAARAIGITLGTGIGASFAIDGRAVPAAEILPNNCDLYALPWKGRTVEEFISTRGIMKLHEDRSGRYRSVKEIAVKSNFDAVAADTMLAFGKELRLVIEIYLLPFAPDAIILGGSISRSSETFLPAMRSGPLGLAGVLKISSHFENAALLGAMADWLRRRD